MDLRARNASNKALSSTDRYCRDGASRDAAVSRKVGRPLCALVLVSIGATFLACRSKSETSGVSGPFVRSLLWNGSGWSGYEKHDWLYCMVLLEGMLWYADLRGGLLDDEIRKGCDYVHTHVNPDGSVARLKKTNTKEYGKILSSLALAYSYFRDKDPLLAGRCRADMDKVYQYLAGAYDSPDQESNFSYVLIGFTNAYHAYRQIGDSGRSGEVKKLIEAYARLFMAHQNPDKSWNTANGEASYHVQRQMKRDIALLLAYDVTSDRRYLTAVRDNLEWIKRNRWDDATGGVGWYPRSRHYFECHQMWFMIAVRYLHTKSQGKYDYLADGRKAWKFLTDDNYAHVDMYLHNYRNHGAFFAYRSIDWNGAIQTHGDFKGSYEIGTALWGMALNYDWVSNYKSHHADRPHNYLAGLVQQTKKSAREKGFIGSR